MGFYEKTKSFVISFYERFVISFYERLVLDTQFKLRRISFQSSCMLYIKTS